MSAIANKRVFLHAATELVRKRVVDASDITNVLASLSLVLTEMTGVECAVSLTINEEQLAVAEMLEKTLTNHKEPS